MTELYIFYAGVVLLVGMCLGSFFNVVIYRMPAGLSVSHPPSACPKCSYEILWYDNIPVLSWLLLRGKCRKCSTGISMQYPLVELFTGLLALSGYLFIWWLKGEPEVGAVLSLELLLMVAVPVVAIDLKHFLIPDIMVLPGALMAFGISFLPNTISWPASLIGGLGSAVGLWLFSWVMKMVLKKEAMGFGDVKLLLFLGALNGLSFTIPTLVLASLSGMLYYAGQRIFKKGEEGMIPFGPFLIVGGLVCLLWGEPLMQYYFDFVLSR